MEEFCLTPYSTVSEFITWFPSLFRGYNYVFATHSLFHGDAFGEVAGFVDVAAAGDGDVISEELEG
jgi:hypothetical protein